MNARIKICQWILSQKLEVGGTDRIGDDEYKWKDCTTICMQEKNISVDIILKLIKVGGRELMMVTGEYGYTALHCACENENISLDVILEMLNMGGRELMMMNKNGYIHYILHV